MTPQTAAILGEEVFVCCHDCQTLRMADGEEVPDDFERPSRESRALH